MERNDVIKEHPSATFARVFSILDVKASENSESKEGEFKARSVLQGNNMSATDGSPVFFVDSNSSPTTMSAIRTVIAYSVMKGEVATQADATQAFV
eukprot:5824049-Amphidinium_carterae.2